MTTERNVSVEVDLNAQPGADDSSASMGMDGGMPPGNPPSTSPAVSAGGVEHLDLRTRAMLLESKSKRIQDILSDRLILHTGLQVILNRVQWLVQEPRNSRARGEIYVGPPGSGKSSISLLIQKSYPLNGRDKDGSPAPKVIAISVSGARTTKAVLNRILTATGVPSAHRTIGDTEQLVIDTLRRMNCRLIIIDELQDIRLARESEQVRVLETIKNTMNQVRLSVLGLGDISARQAFDTDPHMKARFSNYSIPSWEEGSEFADFLMALERCLPLKHRSDLARPEIQKALLKNSGGQLDHMLRRIKAAAVQAVVDGTERITKALLDAELPRPPIGELLGANDV